MKTIDYIRDKIEMLPSDYVFTYVDFTTEVNKKVAIYKNLDGGQAGSQVGGQVDDLTERQ